MSVPAGSSTSRRHTLLNIIVAAIGAILLVFTIRQVGWRDVQSGLLQVGWWFLLVLALGLVRFAARAQAWKKCLESQAAPPAPTDVGFREFLAAFLAGDALGNVTPLGLLASEPAKVLFLRRRLATVDAVASVAIENVFYVASVVAVLAAGAIVFISVTVLPPSLRLGVYAILAAAAAAIATAAIVARHQPAALSRLAHLLARFSGRKLAATTSLEHIEQRFYGMLNWPLPTVARVVLWEAVFHGAAVAEVFLVLRLVPGGAATSLADAFILESTGRLIAVAFKFVPYRLGVDEAGTALVAAALQIDPTAGVTLALIRRLRILCWNACGLVLLARGR